MIAWLYVFSVLCLPSLAIIVFLGVPLLVGRVGRRLSSSTANQLWRVGILLSLMLPLVLLFRPEVMVLSKLGFQVRASAKSIHDSVAASGFDAYHVSTADFQLDQPTGVDGAGGNAPTAPTAPTVAPVGELSSGGAMVGSGNNADPTRPDQSSESAVPAELGIQSSGWWLFAGWGCITCVLVARTLAGYAVAFMLTGNQQEAIRWIDASSSQSEPANHVTGRVRCIRSSRVELPCVVPSWMPTILVPMNFDRWPESSRNAILEHELAHLRRRDLTWQFLANILLAFYWFHPLVYLARRGLRLTAEFASDDAVLNAGYPPHDYADELFCRAQALSRRSPFALISAATSVHSVSARVSEIFNSNKSRAAIGTGARRKWMATTFATLIVSACFAPMITTTESRADESMVAPLDPEHQQNASADRKEAVDPLEAIAKTHRWIRLSHSLLREIERREKLHRGKSIDVRGRVLSPDGIPVANALVVLRMRTNTTWMRRTRPNQRGAFAFRWTDANGRYDFKSVATPWFGWREPIRWETLVLAADYAVGAIPHADTDRGAYIEDVSLKRFHTVTGKFVDSIGQPIAGVKLSLEVVVDARTENMPFDDTNYYQLNLINSELPNEIVSDSDGTVTISGLPPNRIAILRFDVPSVEPMQFQTAGYPLHVATSPDLDRDQLIPETESRSRWSREIYPLHTSTPVFRATTSIAQAGGLKPVSKSGNLPLVLGATANRWGMQISERDRTNQSGAIAGQAVPSFRVIKVRVVDAETSSPLANVYVDWCSDRNGGVASLDDVSGHFPFTLTNDDGVAELVAPIAAINVFVCGRYPGYRTTYGRRTTSQREPQSIVPVDQWVRKVRSSENDETVEFSLQPIPPVRIKTLDKAGRPISADLTVTADPWGGGYRWETTTGPDGTAVVSILPTTSELQVHAVFANGRTSGVNVMLDGKNPLIELSER